MRRVRAALGVLFPEAPEPRPVPESGPGHADAARSAGRRAVYVAIQVAALCMGAVVLLPRIAGIPSWDSVYAEDQGVFLFDALARPWHLLRDMEQLREHLGVEKWLLRGGSWG